MDWCRKNNLNNTINFLNYYLCELQTTVIVIIKKYFRPETYIELNKWNTPSRGFGKGWRWIPALEPWKRVSGHHG